jgi:hypothetical protein
MSKYIRKDIENCELTRRGLTSTMSSGTRKIKAFIFLGIEMASLAVRESDVSKRPYELLYRKELAVLPPVIIRTTITDVDYQRRVDNTRPDGLQKFQEEQPGSDTRILEGANSLNGRLCFLSSCVCPFEHLSIADGSTRFRQRCESLRNVHPVRC